MSFRKTIFFLKDRWLDNAVISRHLNDIRTNYENPGSADVITGRKLRLEQITDYAARFVPFYRALGISRFEEFPVVNKNIIKEDYSRFISDHYRIESLSYVTTSGSTGTPFRSYRDQTKIQRHIADNIFFNSLAGGDIGKRLYYFRVWNKINKKSRLQKFFQNIEEEDASDFTEEYVKGFLERIQRDKSEKYFLSYASSYEAMAYTLQKMDVHPLDANISCIISMSESLPEMIRNYLEQIFTCPVLSRYSNMENGFIAQQSLDNKFEYSINHGSFLVEILDPESDLPVNEGELGRIVITDYFNFGMPFIRYDTGDMAIMRTYNGNPILGSIEGRKTDFIYSVSGKLLSPHMITNTMWKFPLIRQFQFIQKTDKDYLLRINSDTKVEENEIRKEFIDFLGSEANILLEYVNEIPLLASGKRRKIVQEHYKK